MTQEEINAFVAAEVEKKMLELQGKGSKTVKTLDPRAVTIQVKGKDTRVLPIQAGLVQKSSEVFFMQDCITKEWLFVRADVLEARRIKMKNDFSHYMSRETRAGIKKMAAAQIASSAPTSEVNENPIIPNDPEEGNVEGLYTE